MRTEAYRDALEKNPSLMHGAKVLDVGCGTGILSMCAARGGAAAVVGIDGSEQVGRGRGRRGRGANAGLHWVAACTCCVMHMLSGSLPVTQLEPSEIRDAVCDLQMCPQPDLPLPQIAKYARANVEANGLAGKVTIVSSKVEALDSLPLPPAGADGQQQGQGQQGQQQVDVLVSEWMGYALLFESMLGSVLHARDRWLRPGGAVLPDIANIYVAAAGAGASGLGFWSDVYGFRWAGGAAVFLCGAKVCC